MIELKEILNEISSINQSIGTPEITQPVVNLINNKEKTIYVAVLGQFKAGKSSLINSIIGQEILPCGVVPVTAIVTRLKYAPQSKLTIQFLDGKEIVIPINELSKYVSEKQNPENTKKVAQAIVEHPTMEIIQGLSLVDTPGLGSFYQHNSNTTIQWLPFTGFAIIAISAERPLSEEDITLVKNIAHYCPEIAIVLTKIDLFTIDELKEIKSYINQSIHNALGKDITIFEYSIHKNTEQFREKLINELFKPLDAQSQNKILEITHFKIRTILQQSIQYTELALNSALKKKDEREVINRLMQEIINNRHHHEREMLLTGSSFKGEIREKLEKIILPFLSEIIQKLTNQFASNYQKWGPTLFKTSRQFEEWLKKEISNEISIINDKSFDEFNHIVIETAGYYQYAALQFRQRMDEKLKQVFGVNLQILIGKLIL
jgi:GTP-binding protein EngB required for normal cell division